MQKYKYNAICDVCGFKFKADQLRQRWDGYMVCNEDWEPRNILDFYRTRNDAHLLPFTRPDDSGEKSWVAATLVNITGANSATYQYLYNSDTKILTFNVQFVPPTNGTFSIGSPASFSLPSEFTYVSLKGFTLIGSKTGTLIPATGSVTSGSLSFSVGGTKTISETLLIRGSILTS